MRLIAWATMLLSMLLQESRAIAQTKPEQLNTLTKQEQYIVSISAFTAIGDMDKLKPELSGALDAGITVNEIKEVLVQLYAYCGFPRSINAINSFRNVLDERKQAGIIDPDGKPIIVATQAQGKYERGRKKLEQLTGTPQPKPAPGYGEFAPRIDAFLKEHLFADIFDSEVLTVKQRELATISALAAMTGVESQLRSHLALGAKNGIAKDHIKDVAVIIEMKVDAVSANILRNELSIPVSTGPYGGLKIRIAEIEVNKGFSDAYNQILVAEASASVQKEEGVICIFPMRNAGDPDKITILEVYASEAAYQLHLTTPHFQRYKTGTAAMIKSLKLIDLKALDPATIPAILKKIK